MFLLRIFPGTIARAFSPPRRLTMAQSPAVPGLCLRFFFGWCNTEDQRHKPDRLYPVPAVRIVQQNQHHHYAGIRQLHWQLTVAREYCALCSLPAVRGNPLHEPGSTLQ